jgi:uncharacterized membrane protein (DUF2068 family)
MSKNSNSNDILRYRRTGVTILGLLFLISGAFTVVGGIATPVAIPFVTNVSLNAISNGLQLNGEQLTPSEQTALAQGSGSILTVLGALLIPLGIASLVVAYGLFKGKTWAWFVAVVLSTIGLVINAISLVTANMGAITGALVGIAINAIVLYYLSRRNVRQYFGKVATPKQSSPTTLR